MIFLRKGEGAVSRGHRRAWRAARALPLSAPPAGYTRRRAGGSPFLVAGSRPNNPHRPIAAAARRIAVSRRDRPVFEQGRRLPVEQPRVQNPARYVAERPPARPGAVPARRGTLRNQSRQHAARADRRLSSPSNIAASETLFFLSPPATDARDTESNDDQHGEDHERKGLRCCPSGTGHGRDRGAMVRGNGADRGSILPNSVGRNIGGRGPDGGHLTVEIVWEDCRPADCMRGDCRSGDCIAIRRPVNRIPPYPVPSSV